MLVREMNPGLAAASCSAQDTIVSYLQIDNYLHPIYGISIRNYIYQVYKYLHIHNEHNQGQIIGAVSDAPPTVM